jgi:hypothetical protein
MRHFWLVTLAPSLLSSGVAPGPAARVLVPRTGTTARLAPALHRTLPGTINIAAIAPAADADRYPAAPAAIQPVALFPHLDAKPPQDWTAPCIAGINTVRKIAPTGITPLEAREFLTGFPGLHCFGVRVQLKRRMVLRGVTAKSTSRKLLSELLPPMAAGRAWVMRPMSSRN